MSEDIWKIIDDGPEPSLQEAQDFVGGWVEAVTLRNNDCLLINEEGKLNSLSTNKEATAAWEESYGKTDIIVGPAILIKSHVRSDW